MRRVVAWQARTLLWLLALLGMLAAHGAAAQEDDSSVYRRVTFAVFDFEVKARDAPSPFEGEVMADELGTALRALGRFRLINRAEIERVLEELGLSESGLVSRDQQKRFGEQASVDIIVTGSVSILAADLYRITAVFTDVSTSEIADQVTLQASGPEDFDDVARDLAARARDRFPLLGEIRAVADGGAYVGLGIDNGLTEQDKGGRIYRTREVAGSSIRDPIGDFEIRTMYGDLSFIEFQMYEGYELEVGDEVSIDETASADDSSTATDVEGATSESGTITVTSGGVQADVYLDGQLVGRSPASLPEVPAGPHVIRLEAESHEPVEVSVVVTAGETVDVAEALVPLLAELTLDIDVAEYEVFVDGTAQGRRDALALAPGSHEIVVTAPGREAAQFTIELAAGETVRREVVFADVPMLGMVSLHAPVGTKVVAVNTENDEVIALPDVENSPQTFELIHGRYLFEVSHPEVDAQVAEVEVATVPTEVAFPGQLAVEFAGPPSDVTVLDAAGAEVYSGTPSEDLTLAPGDHRLVVTSTGETHELTIESLARTRVRIEASGPTGWLFITSQPQGASVFVDGVPKGNTPLSIPDVPVGLHELTLEAEGYQPNTQAITVTPGGPQRLTVLLQPTQ